MGRVRFVNFGLFDVFELTKYFKLTMIVDHVLVGLALISVREIRHPYSIVNFISNTLDRQILESFFSPF